jgi:hypothetical protein
MPKDELAVRVFALDEYLISRHGVEEDLVSIHSDLVVISPILKREDEIGATLRIV